MSVIPELEIVPDGRIEMMVVHFPALRWMHEITVGHGVLNAESQAPVSQKRDAGVYRPDERICNGWRGCAAGSRVIF
jgi:hypothetical protein